MEANGRILIVRRSPRLSTYPGRWSAISGTIEPGRTAEQQAWQEVWEETTLRPPGIRLLRAGEPFTFVDRQLNRHWTVYPFRFAVERPEDVRLDCENLDGHWIDPADLARYETVPYLLDVWRRVAATSSDWPEPIADRLTHLRADRIRGASELAEEALAIVGVAASSLTGQSATDLRRQLLDLAHELAEARPTMAPTAYWVGRFRQSLPDAAGEDVASYRAAATELARKLRLDAQSARFRIAATAARLIRPGSRVVTASYSSLVVAALQQAPTPLHVTALASLGRDGRSHGETLVARVTRPGVSAEVAPDAAPSTAVQTADLVLLGADAIWPDGSIVNGVPSRALAEAAQAAGCPVYVLAERAKALAGPLEPAEPGFEVVPARFLTELITENGLVL